jgi:hypothetical protein
MTCKLTCTPVAYNCFVQLMISQTKTTFFGWFYVVFYKTLLILA